jgi:nucleoside-diphosphate-sugar epimerase
LLRSFPVNPPWFYGPLAKGFSLPTPNYYALSTSLYIYRLLTPDGHWPPHAIYIDVRDVARAHVLALKSPISAGSNLGHKRLIIAGLDDFEYSSFLELVRSKRPELADRLTKVAPPSGSTSNVPFDVERAEQVLGAKRDKLFTPFEVTMLDTIDAVVGVEKQWVSKGYTIDIPKE